MIVEPRRRGTEYRRRSRPGDRRTGKRLPGHRLGRGGVHADAGAGHRGRAHRLELGRVPGGRAGPSRHQAAPVRRAGRPPRADRAARRRPAARDHRPRRRLGPRDPAEPDRGHDPGGARRGLRARLGHHRRAVPGRIHPPGTGSSLPPEPGSCSSASRSPDYDPARYVTEELRAPAPDGTAIPVTVARRADVALDGSAPCLLYGYGAYEACIDPEFERNLPSLLDRGVVYAIAHIRGGGEGGRQWWQQGRLRAKPTTFSDYIAVADWLAGSHGAGADRRPPDRVPRARRPADCCRARCTRCGQTGGARWSPRCRSSIASTRCSIRRSR